MCCCFFRQTWTLHSEGTGSNISSRLKVFQHTGETSDLLLHDSLGTFRLFQQHAHLLLYLDHLGNTQTQKHICCQYRMNEHLASAAWAVTTAVPCDWLVLSASACHWPAVGARHDGRPGRTPAVDETRRPRCATGRRRPLRTNGSNAVILT